MKFSKSWAMALAVVLMLPVLMGATKIVDNGLKVFGMAAGKDSLRVYVDPGESPSMLPDKYLIWSEDATAFIVARYFAGVLEQGFPVLANTSIYLPAPSPTLRSFTNAGGATTRWEHIIIIDSSAVTDSVFVMPTRGQ